MGCNINKQDQMRLATFVFAIVLIGCTSGNRIQRKSDIRMRSAVYLGEISGMVVQQQLGNDGVLLRAGNRIVHYTVPSWFNEVYGVGDTIR